MSEKILVIEDFTVRGTDDMHVFDILKQEMILLNFSCKWKKMVRM